MKQKILYWLTTCMLVCALPFGAAAQTELTPVGQVIGLELQDGTVSVAAFDKKLGENSSGAGIQVGDVITRINEIPVHSAEDVHAALQHSDGSVVLDIYRKGKAKQVKINPEITKDGPKLGLYLRQGITGIGTVTWYDAVTGTFATLGHGISNSSGKLIEMVRGNAYSARVMAVRKGKSGEPGQLLGVLVGQEPIGTLRANTPQGVFGACNEAWESHPIPIAKSSMVHTGEAKILTTVEGETPREYSVDILKVYPKSRATGRNMLIRVTDPALLAATGGIVQGMSGSPILQDGRLVGAVTHVLVNSPETGYGIFIENMIAAAG